MVYVNILLIIFFIFFIKYYSKIQQYAYFQKIVISSVNYEKIKPLILAAIWALALFSRVYRFPGLPVGINQDEAMAAINAKALLTYGRDITGVKFPVYLPAWGSSQMNILESILMIPAIGIFGMNAFSARLPMLLVSLVSVIVVYDFAKRLFGDGVALLCMFFISISPWHIMLSRWGLESNLFPAFILFAFYFMYRGAVEKKAILLFVSMLFWGLTMYAYGIAYFATPFILVISAIYFIKNKIIKPKIIALCSLIYLFVSMPIFLMMYVNYFKLPSINLGFITIPYFPDAERMKDMIISSGDFADQARNNFLYIIRNLLQYPDVPWNLIPDFGTLYIFTLPLLIYGFTKMDKSGIASFIIYLWLAAAFLTGMIINTAGTNQINILFLPLIFLCSIGMKNIFDSGNKPNRHVCVADLLPIAAYVVVFAVFMFAYNGKIDKYSTYSFYDGFGEAVAAADRSGRDRIYITSWTQYEYAAYVSEILTLFHCDIDSKYYRGETTNEHGLYADRYKYGKFMETPEGDASAAYVINMGGDGHLFPYSKFIISRFGEYAVAISKD